ncbi:MAG: aryl-sulfate sulfotransferase [Anaerolineae bacterium]|nr:aryl-sulfate sulfotransferase [Anaerolineae bacterium]MDQ7033327.1 aryl-sulfate sulfotransferase [Anaerolineae bacterium]
MTPKIRYIVLIFALLLLSVFSFHTSAQSDLPENFPSITVDVNIAPAEGLLYLANIRRRNAEDEETGSYLMALQNDGTPTFWQAAGGGRVFNFGVAVTGERYFYRITDNGLGSGAAMDGSYWVLDDNGEVVREYHIQGDITAPHEFIMLENGNAILISNPVREMDMTAYGGHPEALVVGLMVQEITAEGEVVFEWDAWDVFDIGDTVAQNMLTAEPPNPVAYIHGNGMTIDRDGNWIISLRRFDSLIKIDRSTGDLLWVMGGVQSPLNEFTFINDPMNGFSGQHNPTILPNGNLLLFDNGTLHEAQQSRAVEYELDQENRTATLVWSYTDGRYSATMGSAQRLSNGNTLIGWGSAPPTGSSVSEVNADGEVVYALSLPPSQINYRVYRVEP